MTLCYFLIIVIRIAHNKAINEFLIIRNARSNIWIFHININMAVTHCSHPKEYDESQKHKLNGMENIIKILLQDFP